MTGMIAEMQLSTSTPVMDALAFLADCHESAIELFAGYRKAQTAGDKRNLVCSIALELKTLFRVEEEVLFNVVGSLLPEKSIISSLKLRHATLVYLLDELDALGPESEVFDIKIKVLGKHVEELFWKKQRSLFGQIDRLQQVDLWLLGARMVQRREELLLESSTGNDVSLVTH